MTDPAGELANNLLDSTDGSAVRFTVGDMDGPYHVHCTVTDAGGREHRASIVLQVGGSIGLDVTTERFGVVAGGGPLGQTTIRLEPRFGRPPFDVSWTCTGPDGKIDNDRLDTTDPLAPRFTSSDPIGTYVLMATVVDANGATSVESVIVVVGQILGLDVIAGRASVLPGGGDQGMVTLLATPIGGSQPYQYDWEVVGPDGTLRNELLWDTSVRSPVFESDDVTGTYVARCAVTDKNGTVLIGSTTIAVGQQISVDVTADRLALPVGGAGGAQAALTADIRGGREPISINWHVVGPGGRDDTALLNANGVSQIIFTPGDRNGSYVVRCTVTDADRVSSTDSLVLTVGGTMGVTVIAARTSLAAGGVVPGGVTTLGVQVYAGTPPYTYDWSVLAPTGEPEPARLDNTSIEEPTFTSSSRIGTYLVSCMVTDATGAAAVDTVSIIVGQPLNVDVTVDKQALIAGGGVSGQAQLITTVNGGSSPYAYQWSVIGPSNTPEPSRLSNTQIAGPVFISDLATGTYRLTLTTTDALGAVFVDSVELVVGSAGAPGQAFSADVSIDRSPVPPSGGTALLAVMTVGGVPPISYAWTVTDPGGGTDNARLDSTNNQTVTFTSIATQGTYRVRCRATDAVGSQFSDSVQFNVTDSFGLDVTAAVVNVAPGDTVSVFADRTGGAADFTYTWSSVDDAGTPVGTFAIGSVGPGAASQIANDDVSNAWTAPPAGSGTYRIRVSMTDALGNSAIDSVQIVARSSLSLNVTANNTFVPPTTPVTLLADQTGGEPPYTYAWQAVNANGTNAGAFTTGAGAAGTATQAGEAGDAINGWSIATEGAYTVICTVTDNAGQVFTDSVPVVVTSQQGFSLDVTADELVVAPGEAVNLVGDQTGGIPNFNYAWSVLDEADSPAGTLGATNQNGVVDDTTNTWTAPSGASVEGTYRIFCTVTDAQNRTSTDTAIVKISSLALQNIFLAPAAADTTSVLGVTTLMSQSMGGGVGQQILAGMTHPTHPRNLVITITDADNSITGGTARIIGLDARGVPRVELISIEATAASAPPGVSTNIGVVPFATVTEIDLYDFNGVDTFFGNDKASVGVGDKFGLTGVLESASDVLYVNEDGSVITTGYTVDATAGQQGITFASPPDGTADYVVVFRAR